MGKSFKGSPFDVKIHNVPVIKVGKELSEDVVVSFVDFFDVLSYCGMELQIGESKNHL